MGSLMYFILLLFIGCSIASIIEDPINHEIILNLREGQKNAYLEKGYVSLASVDENSILVSKANKGKSSRVFRVPKVRSDYRACKL